MFLKNHTIGRYILNYDLKSQGLKFLTVLLCSLFAVSCTLRSTKDAAKETSPNGNSISENSQPEIKSFHLSDAEGPELVSPELESIPSEVNPMVEKWLVYFQGRGRDHMERYLSLSTRYEKLMKKVLRNNGLPEDVFYIAMIESGFSPRAVSHASAVGYWQFIRGTGKRYGLEINKFVDERRDPVLATQAAADYFRGLYSVFGSWYLAMASYNVGENRVKKEVMNHMTRDFWELAKKKRFPRETINYIPKYLAARLIAKNPEKFGFDGIDYMPPIEFDTITTNAPVNLRLMAEKMNYNYEDFKALNPKFKGEIAPLKGDHLDLRIPVGQKELALAAAKESAVSQVEYIADSGDTQIYKIRRGDNLSSIAKRYRTTAAYLRDLNDLPRGKRLRLGMRLYVPDRTPLKERSSRNTFESGKIVETAPNQEAIAIEGANSNGRYYVVQSGDSLFTIAKKYNTTVETLKKINNITHHRLLKIGVKLLLPGGEEKTPEVEKESRNSSNTSGRRNQVFNNSKRLALNKKNVNRNLASINKSKKTKVLHHVVRRGENLQKIASRYKVDPISIKRKNKLQNTSRLFVGTRLLIPVAHAGNGY